LQELIQLQQINHRHIANFMRNEMLIKFWE